jgi:hypothetical protein
MLILFFDLVAPLPKRKGTTQPAPKRLRSPGSRPTRFAILLVHASQAPQEKA